MTLSWHKGSTVSVSFHSTIRRRQGVASLSLGLDDAAVLRLTSLAVSNKVCGK